MHRHISSLDSSSSHPRPSRAERQDRRESLTSLVRRQARNAERALVDLALELQDLGILPAVNLGGARRYSRGAK